MFAHIFATRFKCIIRDRYAVFWTLMFPIILGTLFHFAFANLNKDWNFQKFNIAVVNNAQLKSGTAFKSALDSVSGNKKSALFKVAYCSRQKADSLLNNSKIEGYIYYDKDIKLAVKQSGFNPSILKAFLDEYKQKSDAVATIMKNNQMGMTEAIKELSKDTDYLKTVPLSGSKSKSNELVSYFYALIAMACLFGGYYGMKEICAIQANQSAQGARVNMAPVGKLKVFLSSICAATAVQAISAFVLLAYLIFVLKVDFGTKVPLIVLACAVSSFTGVSFGAFIGSIIKSGEGLKAAVLTSSTMIMSFLAGLMFGGMQYIIQKNAPVIGFLNPARAMSDSFYSLYYYDTYTKFFENIGILAVFSVLFYLGVYFVLRRQKYDSI